MTAEGVAAWRWCDVCRRSVPPSELPRHAYTTTHQKHWTRHVDWVIETLQRAVEPSLLLSDAAQFVCPLPLCARWQPPHTAPDLRHAVWQHLAHHTAAVEAFVTACTRQAALRASAAPPRIPSPAMLSLAPTLVQKRIMQHLTEQSKAAEAPQPPPASDTPRCAATPSLGPKTLVSRHGVLQNSSGRHNGQRVWGGGIVALSTGEWLPWDLDAPHPAHPPASTDEQLLPPPPQSGVAAAALGLSMLPRSTNCRSHLRAASLDGMQQQSPPLWHAAVAVPCGETGGGPLPLPPPPPPARLTLHQHAEQLRQKLKQARKFPHRIGAAWANARLRQMQQQQQHDQSPSAPDAHWLPAFGGVWNEGSRAQHLHSFRHAEGGTRTATSPE